MTTSGIARAGRAVAVAAFSLTTMAGLALATSTPVTELLTAEKVGIHFRPEVDASYLEEVRLALAARDVDLAYTNLRYDEEGRLVELAIEVKHDAQVKATEAAALTPDSGMYLLVDFG